jgi:diketogulonate reductase-like aldo/keto reductase
MADPVASKQNRRPIFIYGTAWKEGQTQRLTELALQAGFRAIDTANQRKHYDEAAVGEAIGKSITNGLARREELFLQTKFTFRRGQDHRLPYAPNAAIGDQVEQSFASSLEHLGTEYVDSYLLHGPTSSHGLEDSDWAAWRAMETIHDRGLARSIGVSNVTLEQLRLLHSGARIKPSTVQNRCYASRGWDRQVREFCAEHEIMYQGFSLLTANREVLGSPKTAEIAARRGKTIAQVVFRFAIDAGMVPLTGTSSSEHMRSDLDVSSFSLGSNEVQLIERLAVK